MPSLVLGHIPVCLSVQVFKRTNLSCQDLSKNLCFPECLQRRKKQSHVFVLSTTYSQPLLGLLQNVGFLAVYHAELVTFSEVSREEGKREGGGGKGKREMNQYVGDPLTLQWAKALCPFHTCIIWFCSWTLSLRSKAISSSRCSCFSSETWQLCSSPCFSALVCISSCSKFASLSYQLACSCSSSRFLLSTLLFSSSIYMAKGNTGSD